MTALPVSAFPAPTWPERDVGELVQSLTYRQSYTPAAADTYRASAYDRPARRLTADAPPLLRSTAAGTWALVSATAALGVLVVLVLVLVRIVGWLT